MGKKKIRKELDETIKIICKKAKAGEGMTEQQKGTISALVSLISARALLNYESDSFEDLSPIKDERTA